MESIELNDLTPLVPSQSVETIYEPHFDAKFFEIDFTNVKFEPNFPFNLINFDGIFIKNAPNLQNVIEVLTKRFFVNFFNRQASTFILKVDITDIESINPSEVQKLMEKFDKKIFLISFENSKNEEVQFFWKFQEEKIFWTRIQKEISKFFLNFLASSMRNDGHCGISEDFLSTFQSTEKIFVDKVVLTNSSGLNLLMIAAERGDSNAVNFLLKSGFNVNEKVNEKSAVDLAWDNQHFEVVLQLLKANSWFPSNFKVSLATDEIKEFIKRGKLRKLPIFGTRNKIRCLKTSNKMKLKILVPFILAIPFAIWLTTLLVKPYIEPLYSCGNLTDELRYKILESTVDFQGVNVIFGDLFGRNSSACEHLSSQNITNMLKVYDSGKYEENYTGIYRNFTAEENQRIFDRANSKDENFDRARGVFKKILESNLNQSIYEERNEDIEDNIFIKYMKIKFRKPSLKINKKVTLRAKFYVERWINFQKFNGNPTASQAKSFPIGFNELSTAKLVLLSDKGGSGKTTYFRHMAWKLKRRFPLKWIFYVDLKQHIDVLQNIPQSDANLTTLVDFLSSKLLKLTSKVEIEIFERKFLTNDSIFLWDAVDEVSPMYTDEVLSLIEIVVNLTENHQWMATRPHLEKIIQSKFEIGIHKFEKLSSLDKGEFIGKLLDSKGIKSQNLSKIIADVQDLAKNLQKGFDSEKYLLDLSENLQFFHAICEGYVKNLSLVDRTVNLYEIFETYVEKVFQETYNEKSYTKDDENEGDIPNSDINRTKKLEGFQKIHQHFGVASRLVVHVSNIYTAESNIRCENLEICRPLKDFKDEEVLKFGIVYKNDEKLIFEHLILKSFFIAQYFFTDIWNLESENHSNSEANQRLLYLFYVINENVEQFKITPIFIIGFIEANSNKTAPLFSQPIKHLMLTNYTDLLTILGDIYKRIDIATKFFKKDRDVISELWKINKNRTFFHEFFEKTILPADVASLKKIVDENFNKEEDRKQILEGRHQSANFLRMAWQKRGNKNSTIAFMNAVNFNCDVNNLRKITKFGKFMEFLESEYFTREELREFFIASLGTRALKTENDVKIFIQYAKKLLSVDDYAELSKYWEPYEI